MVLPLEDIRVLDFSNLLPGPFCTMTLADLGAEVIKVERPTIGDATRRNKTMFNTINRNKKSIAIDLKDPTNIDFVKSYVRSCDVLVEGFRPGVMQKLGLDYEEISKLNSRIVYCSISGYGQTGALARVPGHDINYLALAGALSISGDPKGPPAAWGGMPIADLTSSMYAVVSILAALRNRDKTSKGDYIDVSITDSVLAWMAPRIGQFYDKGKLPKDSFMGKGAYGAFETEDAQYIALGSLEDQFFTSTCIAIERPELADNEKYKTQALRSKNAVELNRELQKEIYKRSVDEWLSTFEKLDVPCSKVMNIDEIPQVNTFKERGNIEYYGNEKQGEYFVQYPVKFLNIPSRTNKMAPDLGEYNRVFYQPNDMEYNKIKSV